MWPCEGELGVCISCLYFLIKCWVTFSLSGGCVLDKPRGHMKLILTSRFQLIFSGRSTINPHLHPHPPREPCVEGRLTRISSCVYFSLINLSKIRLQMLVMFSINIVLVRMNFQFVNMRWVPHRSQYRGLTNSCSCGCSKWQISRKVSMTALWFGFA